MKKDFLPVLVVFIVVNCVAIVFGKQMHAKGFDAGVIIGGNLVIFIATIASTTLYLRALSTKSPQAIMRSVYGGFMLKFFIMLIAALAYIALAKPINKPALFTCMGLYLVYHFLGIQNVLKQKKRTPDANAKTSL